MLLQKFWFRGPRLSLVVGVGYWTHEIHYPCCAKFDTFMVGAQKSGVSSKTFESRALTIWVGVG